MKKTSTNILTMEMFASKATENLGLAYNNLIGLKGSMDKMHEIPSYLMPFYKSTLKAMAQVGKAKDTAYNVQMNLRKERRRMASNNETLEGLRKVYAHDPFAAIEIAEALDFDISPKTAAHFQEGKKWYVDSSFINLVQRVYPQAELRHMGFGEFYLNTPDGRLDFNRSRGISFEGQVGRSHLLEDDQRGKVISKAIEYMEKAKKSLRM